MSLTEYKRKRHFNKTPEPAGHERTPRKARALAFVVQKHDASRLHYDFRLEMGGVLKSWAVPKGPSLDPTTKCLAVQVEDHPIEYGKFEGIIPQGEYGGGTVMLWDRGTWEPEDGADPEEGWRTGKLRFVLHGEKLGGRWLLVRMSPRRPGDKPQWLLRKSQDEFARPQDEYDVREARDRSVASGRSMDEIASAADRTWKSNRAASNGTAKPRRKPSASNGLATERKRPSSSPRAGAPSVALGKMPGAVRAVPPAFVEPELCLLVDASPEGDEWIHESKFDGYRILAHIGRSGVRLLSRNNKDWTGKFAGIARGVDALGLRDTVIDGEVVALDERGLSSFQALQGQLKGRGSGLVYYVFDLPFASGHDLRACTLADRRKALRALIGRAGKSSPVRFSDAIRGNGAAVFQNACKLNLEGVVSKRLDSKYVGERGRGWVKVKCKNRQEVVIGGYTEPRRTRTAFGALHIGYYDGGELRYAGKVGTGFDEKMLTGLLEKLRPLEQERPPFVDPPRGFEAKGAHWVRPLLVAEVEFTEWTNDGALRHPSFTGLREDKPAAEVVREKPRPVEGGGGVKKKSAGSAKLNGRVPRSSRTVVARAESAEASILGVRLTHPDKVLYPDQGITKRDLAEYYAAVGERMLEQVRGRPLMLVRCPAGQQATCFHQKNWDDELPAGSHGLLIEEQTTSNTYIIVDEPPGLVWLVQRGVLEMHNWGSTEEDLERPDRLVLDLDPAPEVAWKDVRDAALQVRSWLDKLGLETFVKTTGGKGLHVVAPLRPKAGWDAVKEFAHKIALELQRSDPSRYIATMSKAKRTGKIYVDYLRNGRGSTWIAPHSTRSRPGGPVSVPLSWKELKAMAERPAFGLAEAIARAKRADPWAGMKSVKQSIKAG